MQKIDFNDTRIHLAQQNTTEPNVKLNTLLQILADAEEPLFQKTDQIKPIKPWQVGRIIKLAKLFINFITLVWPYLKLLVELFSKKPI